MRDKEEKKLVDLEEKEGQQTFILIQAILCINCEKENDLECQ